MNISSYGKMAIDRAKAKQAKENEKTKNRITRMLQKMGISDIPTMEGSIISVGQYVRIAVVDPGQFMFPTLYRIWADIGRYVLPHRQFHDYFRNSDELKEAIDELYVWIAQRISD